MSFRLRRATGNDIDFLADMLVEATYPLRDPKPTKAEALGDPRVAAFLEAWGRPGDLGVVAQNEDGRLIGAAWCRRFAATAPGWGFVAEDVPELAIAVGPDVRGHGVGSALLAELIRVTTEAGVRALSLEVDIPNTAAVQLYAKAGFGMVSRSPNAAVMLLDLSAEPRGSS